MILKEVPQASSGTCAHVNQFSIFAVINDQFSSLKQYKFIILQLCRSEVLYGYHWTKAGCHQSYIFFFSWRFWRRFHLQDYLGCWQNSVPWNSRIKDSFLADGQLKAPSRSHLPSLACGTFPTFRARNRKSSPSQAPDLSCFFFCLLMCLIDPSALSSAFKDSCDQTGLPE